MGQISKPVDLKKYFQSQTEICLSCNLFSDKKNNGSKIIMLFAEAFSFMVDIYGLKNITNLIVQYSNTTGFKKWFWNVKYNLGQCLKEDPSFYEIGKWIGKGFFLKMCFSMIIYNGLILDEAILNKIIARQKKLLNELKKESILNNINIEDRTDSYILLNQKINLSTNNECFYIENIII